jgi:sortase A
LEPYESLTQMNIRKTLGVILFGAAILIALFTLLKALMVSPNTEDTGILGGEKIRTEEVRDVVLPRRLRIPDLGIDTDVQYVGVTRSGNMAVPNNYTDVGWYKYGSVPGEVGSAVMAGHETNGFALDGVFKRLNELSIGDDIYVVRNDGSELHFKVMAKEIYPYDAGPVEKIFDVNDAARLNLITCIGDWIPEKKTNDKRLVVFTRLVES